MKVSSIGVMPQSQTKGQNSSFKAHLYAHNSLNQYLTKQARMQFKRKKITKYWESTCLVPEV